MELFVTFGKYLFEFTHQYECEKAWLAIASFEFWPFHSSNSSSRINQKYTLFGRMSSEIASKCVLVRAILPTTQRCGADTHGKYLACEKHEDQETHSNFVFNNLTMLLPYLPT